MAAKRVVRRQQVVRQRTNGSLSFWRRMREQVGPVSLFFGLVFLAAATAIALYGTHSRGYAVGQKIDQPIYAEVDFQVINQQQTLRVQQTVRASVPSHYRVDYNLMGEIGTELLNLYQAAQASETFEVFQERAVQAGWQTDETVYGQLRSYAGDSGTNAFEHSIGRLRNRLILEYTQKPDAEKERTPASSAEEILVHADDPKEEGQPPRKLKRVSIFDILPISNETSLKRAANDLAAESNFAPSLRSSVADILVRRLSQKPLLVYDAALTNELMSAEAEAVEPVTVSFGRKEPMILPRIERGLTYADLELIAAHDKSYREFIAGDAEGAKSLRDRKLLQRMGTASIFVLITVGLFSYVGTYQGRVFRVVGRSAGFVALLLGTLLASRLIDAYVPIKDLIVGPPLFAASVLAIAYSRRFAVGVMTIVAVMIVLSVGGDAALLVTLIIGLRATVYLLNDIRTRTRLMWVGGMSAGAVFVSATGFGLLDGQAWQFAAIRGCWGAGAGLASAMLLQATLPLVERILRIATSLTLLEWRDTTRPLLQRLAREAPGTYTHSLALGTLAEAACREIGANGLLAQVGALYHDVGKLHKASYFAENQEAAISRHEKLAPTMSLLIIIGHVKDGVEMAKEYKLPRVLHQFIHEHHGTTVVRYFHHMASEQQPHIARGKHDREVPESQFRYPGPKPKTRESAVLMLCDGVESAVRALSDPTPGRIENVVHQIITDRLNDGQFDDCDITLRELHRVEESLAKSLCSYYHARVAYPKPKEKAGRPVEEQARADEDQEVERKSIAG